MENLKEVRAMRINGELMASGKIKSLNEKRREKGMNTMIQVTEERVETIDTCMFNKISANKQAYNKHLEDLAYDRWLDEQYEQQARERKISYKISSIFRAIARDLAGK